MSNIIDPPVLLSRLLTFVFATSLVVVLVLIITLVKMYPLNKTQVFFLATAPRAETEIQLTKFSPNADNFEIYKRAFAREYIKARNEIVPNAGFMKSKWGTNGVVAMWSTPDVYAKFNETAMWNAYMNEMPDFEFNCPVEFSSMAPRSENKYAISFRYFCRNSDGQEYTKDYTIELKLEIEDTKIKWTDRLHNPLGIVVSEYTIESGNGDPLDFK